MAFEHDELSRRGALAAAGLLSTGVLVAVGGLLVPAEAAAQARKKRQGRPAGAAKKPEAEEEVSATEDLMREHGVLRRTLIVYFETARVLRGRPESIDPSALVDAARLFRAFGENYHERILEEQYVFPEVRSGGGDLAGLVEILLRQHQRGREITDYVERVAGAGRIGTGDAEPPARALEGMTRMYNAHAAW